MSVPPELVVQKDAEELTGVHDLQVISPNIEPRGEGPGVTEVEEHDGTFVMVYAEQVVSCKVTELIEEELQGIVTVL